MSSGYAGGHFAYAYKALLPAAPDTASVCCQQIKGVHRMSRYESTSHLFYRSQGNDSNLLIVFYVQIMPDDFVMQLHRF